MAEERKSLGRLVLEGAAWGTGLVIVGGILKLTWSAVSKREDIDDARREALSDLDDDALIDYYAGVLRRMHPDRYEDEDELRAAARHMARHEHYRDLDDEDD